MTRCDEQITHVTLILISVFFLNSDFQMLKMFIKKSY